MLVLVQLYNLEHADTRLILSLLKKPLEELLDREHEAIIGAL